MIFGGVYFLIASQRSLSVVLGPESLLSRSSIGQGIPRGRVATTTTTTSACGASMRLRDERRLRRERVLGELSR